MPSTHSQARSTRTAPPVWRALAAGALWLGGLACGGSAQSAQDPAAAGSGKSEVQWKDKTREQRMDWMGLQVFPKMKGVFTEFDADRFSGFACQTCHGDDMEMVDFKMPTKKLYGLPRKDVLKSAREYDAKVTDFMLGTVMPKMAELLDMQPYDSETKSGFGCFGCHPMESE
ncbi:MAG: hypothetical protein ABI895_02905 [Deltaproteobacteria bacterium]